MPEVYDKKTENPTTLQVLVAAMEQTDHTLLEKMHLESDALIGNQCPLSAKKAEVESFMKNGFHYTYYTFPERGVSLNRNTILMRAKADIVLFADEDLVYEKGYQDKILKAYQRFPKADLILFNVRKARGKEAFQNTVTREGTVGRLRASRFGTYCISARLEKLRQKNLYFHLWFGGGSSYQSGEDTLFLQDCLRHHLKIYACTDTIGCVKHEKSTWFFGYNREYFFQKGILFSRISPIFSYLRAAVHLVRYRKIYAAFGLQQGYQAMIEGIRFERNGYQ